MIANILYRLPGETRPLFFSNTRNQFVFTLVEDPTRYFMYSMNEGALYEFEGIATGEDLVQRMEEDADVLPLRVLEPNVEGEDVIRRILERDESVVPLLAERFLSYTPEITEPWEENPVASRMLSDEEREKIELGAAEKVRQVLEKDSGSELSEEEQSRILEELRGDLAEMRGKRQTGD
ncbi:hypothetical protein AX17_007202 [Amanita inopinata Kibby_2008]|nr:hypothetical protein AX17_007202 [Amanita inopinata Kibby_2008]